MADPWVLVDERPVLQKKGCICPNCLEKDVVWWQVGIQPEPETEKICNTCIYWMKILSLLPELSIRIDGVHYQLDKGGINNPALSPYYGKKFKIRTSESGEVMTVGLWLNDRIPEWAQDDLPDNAEWVRNDATGL